MSAWRGSLRRGNLRNGKAYKLQAACRAPSLSPYSTLCCSMLLPVLKAACTGAHQSVSMGAWCGSLPGGNLRQSKAYTLQAACKAPSLSTEVSIAEVAKKLSCMSQLHVQVHYLGVSMGAWRGSLRGGNLRKSKAYKHAMLSP